MKNLSRMLNRVLPHLTIILALLCFLLFAIDRFNSNMMFLANDLTKWILALLCVCAMYCGVSLIAPRYRANTAHVRAHRASHSDAVTIAPDESDEPPLSAGKAEPSSADESQALQR